MTAAAITACDRSPDERGDDPNACPTPCECVIAQSDLGIIVAAFGSSVGDPNYNPRADLNLDGHVGQAELGCLLASFGERCPVTVDCPALPPAPAACGQ